MALDIKHPEKPTESNKIDDNDYMLSHTITGNLDNEDMPGDVLLIDGGLSGTVIRFPILIESKIITEGVSYTDFLNLNGDVDEIYLLIIENVLLSGAYMLKLQPNGADTNCWSGQYYIVDASTGGLDSFNYCYIGGQTFSEAPNIVGEYTLYAKTGQQRKYFGRSSGRTTNHHIANLVNGLYKDTSTNITSLRVAVSSGTFTGKIKLYKLKDITFE